jgi:hypothetical protein
MNQSRLRGNSGLSDQAILDQENEEDFDWNSK